MENSIGHPSKYQDGIETDSLGPEPPLLPKIDELPENLEDLIAELGNDGWRIIAPDIY